MYQVLISLSPSTQTPPDPPYLKKLNDAVIVRAIMTALLESKAVLREDGHVIFLQLIEPAKGQEPVWVDVDMSLLWPGKDEFGHTSEGAFLYGIALAKNTTEEQIRDQLKQEGVIYLCPPSDKSAVPLQ
jgi:hypothetical protein